MADDAKTLYKKVSSLRNLTEAIKHVKKTLTASEPIEPVKVTKAEPATELKTEAKPGHQLKYLGRKKMLDGVLTHMIGSGAEGHPHYQIDVHLEKHSKGMPCVMISHVSPEGQILDQSTDHHKNLKDAIQSLVHHSIKKSWK